MNITHQETIMTDKEHTKSDSCPKMNSFGCYMKTREQILKDMDKQAERFRALHEKVTRKIARGVRRYTDDAL
jgi:hypothetical protein